MKPFKNLSQIQENIINGNLTIVQLVEYYLSNIEASNHLNIYVEVFKKESLERARRLDRKILSDPSSVGDLFGTVISIKDVICYKGHVASAGSKMLENFRSQFTATALQKALDADAIVIGRTNCDEFAMGSTTEHSLYGPTLNGIDPTRIPGGSSGGAAVSVQQNTCLLALGSDTGGSVRQPAAFCGLFGLKPTYGRISRYGLIAYASSFDQIGIIGHSEKDIASLLSVISGKDPMDATSLDIPLSVGQSKEANRDYKIAYFPEIFKHKKLNADMHSCGIKLLDILEKSRHKVSAVSFDLLNFLIPTYYVLTTAEASSNLSRYDGIKYGYRSNSTNIEDLYASSRSEGFGIEVKRRIIMGSFVLSVGYYDAYYSKAQQVRNLIATKINELLKKYDFIILPTTTGPAWKLGESLDDPLEIYLSDIYTVLANLCGLPSISIPLYETSDSLPLGIQLIGRKFMEEDLLAFSALIKTLA